MVLIIDGGGSSTRGYVVDENRIVLAIQQDQGNIAVNYETALIDYRLVIKQALTEFKITKTIVFAAGFAEVDETTKKRFIDDITATLAGFNCNEVLVSSDADLPLCITHGNIAAITLGTGTAFLARINDEVQSVFGFGHLISDPFSGHALARRFIFEVLSKGDETERLELFRMFDVEDYKMLVNKIYTNPSKKMIAAIWKKAEKSSLLQPYFEIAIEKESTDFFQEQIVALLEQVETIVLNGSVAMSDYFRKELDKHIHTKAKIVALDDENQKILLVAKNFS